MLIEVTRQDVEEGRACESGRCPVAMAIRRAVGCSYVAVNVECVLLGDGRLTRAIGLPFDVGEAIALFDRAGVMTPFSFELALEDQMARAGGASG
jgi:hypothetical protein